MSALSLEDQVIVALRRITRAIDLHSRGLMQEFGLTAPQLAALQAVQRLQPITAGALARSIHLSQATITGILSRLERRDLISRARSDADRSRADSNRQAMSRPERGSYPGDGSHRSARFGIRLLPRPSSPEPAARECASRFRRAGRARRA